MSGREWETLRRVSVRLYRGFLLAYPRAHRARFAAPMEATFAELCERRLDGPVSALRIWLREYPTLLWLGVSARLGLNPRGATSRRRPIAVRASAGVGGAGALAGWAQDVAFGVRMLKRRPLFATVVTLTLMLGIGLNVAIFSVLYGVLLQPLPFDDPDELLRVGRATPARSWNLNPLSPSEFRDLAPALESVRQLTAVGPALAVWSDPEEPLLLQGAAVSEDFFDLFRVAPLHGRFFAPEDALEGAPSTVVLAHEFWRTRLGGDPARVGSTITLGGEALRVVGIAPPRFAFQPETGLDGADYWVPMRWTEELLASRHAHWVMLYGRLAPDAELPAALDELAIDWRTLIADDPGNHLDESYEIGLSAARLHDFTVAASRSPLLFLAGAVTLVLTIACVNVANLMLAHTDSRRHELAVRAALGAGRLRLLRQFLAETLVLSGIGGAMGVLFADVTVRMILARYPDAVPRSAEVGLHLPVVGFAVGVAMLTALGLGIAAAIRSRTGTVELRSGGGRSNPGSGMRTGLVVAEIALALVLVIGAGLLIRSFWNVRGVDLGFDPDRLLALGVTLPLPPGEESATQAAFYRDYRELLHSLPEVEATTMIDLLPIRFTGRNISGVAVAGKPERRVSYVETRRVTPGYFEALGIPLAAGRVFDDADLEAGTRPVIVNRLLAERLFDSGETVIGSRLALDPEVEIVGVVENMHGSAPDRDLRPYIYAPTSWAANLLVRVRSPDPATALPQLRAAAREIDPGARIHAADSFHALVEDSLGSRRFQLLLVNLFAATALALAAVGIYGVMAYTIQGRMRDFGIRMAIGARAGDIRLLVLRWAGGLTVVGLLIGLAGAWLLRGSAAGLLFEVDPGDPTVYAVVALLLAGVAGLACWFPAHRAATADPLETLREG